MPAISLLASLLLIGPPNLLAAELPVRRVALFSSGVGYFECQAVVEGNDAAELRFRPEQINDILKSLVLEDLDGGRVGVVSYPTRQPTDRALKSFAVDLTGSPTLAELLSQLRGIEAEVAEAETFRGPIVAVEKRKRYIVASQPQLAEIDVLTILTSQGLRSVALPDIRYIRLLDERIDAELKKALATLATSRDTQLRPVRLTFLGQGKRRVRAGYLIETPVWKTSYRLVLRDDQKALLQGWAIVENMTDQDWNQVQLTLISGRPISFIQDLYQPLYAPRPKVEPELYAWLRPRLHEEALQRRAAPKAAPSAELPRAKVLALGRRLARGRLGAGLAQAEDRARAQPLTGAGVQALAAAQRVGELFQYAIDIPVTLPRHSSAMLPIVNRPVEAEKVSIYNPALQKKYALNGVLLTNTTALHLMQGPVTVFDTDTYAGDARLDDLAPGQKRLLSYALDLKCQVEMQRKSTPSQTVSIRIAKGTMIVRSKHIDKRTYRVKNDDTKPRTLLIEQPYQPDWKLVEPPEPFERTRQHYRFRLTVQANSTAELPVRLERYDAERVILTEAGLDTIRIYLRSDVLSHQLRQALQRVVEMRQDIDQTLQHIQNLQQRLNEIDKDQQRIRRNMRELPRNSQLFAKYLKKLEQQESRIEDLRKQLADLQQRQQQQRRDLQQYLLSLEVS